MRRLIVYIVDCKELGRKRSLLIAVHYPYIYLKENNKKITQDRYF